jgi:enterochelin esterase-like enzyme
VVRAGAVRDGVRDPDGAAVTLRRTWIAAERDARSRSRGGRVSRAAFATLLGATMLVACAIGGKPVPPASPPAGVAPLPMDGPSPGRFVTYDAFPSKHVSARRVVVWLPDGYDTSVDRYAVLYMHDGQNLYDPATSMGGEPWAVDRHLARLARDRRVRPTIVVGVWNSPTRSRDYAPAAPLATLPAPERAVATPDGSPAFSDGYVSFLADELKPYVDAHFRTRPGRNDTFVMGSSMGGLISLYALATRPEVFGGAGCVSTHWPVSTAGPLLDKAIRTGRVDPRIDAVASANLDWLRAHLPRAGTHRLYFDHGTEHLDSLYAPYQARMDAILRDLGYRPGVDAMTRVYPGSTHNEQAWRVRLEVPLTFLLRP